MVVNHFSVHKTDVFNITAVENLADDFTVNVLYAGLACVKVFDVFDFSRFVVLRINAEGLGFDPKIHIFGNHNHLPPIFFFP